MEDLVFVDLRLQFGLQGSPGEGGVSERNSGSPSDDDVGIGRYIGGSYQSDQPRGRGGADEEGRGAITTWMPGSEDARQERPVRDIFFLDDAISVEVQRREDGARCKR